MCNSNLSPIRMLKDVFDSPDPPKINAQPPAPPPTLQDPAVMMMRNRERRRLQGESGRQSTILTSGQGAVMDKVQNKTLLGS